MSRSAWATAIPIAGAIALGAGLVLFADRGPTVDQSEQIAIWRGEDPGCPVELTAADVDRGIELATTWLLANQLPTGAFVESRDWRAGTVDESWVPDHQAAALWALSRLHRAAPADAIRASLERGLALHRAQPPTQTEATSLLAAAASELDPEWRDQLLAAIASARTDDLRVRRDLGTPEASPSPEADAGALLAMVQAAADGRTDLVEPSKPLWRSAWLHDVENPRKKRRDPEPTKRLFPLMPAALALLADSGWLSTEDAGPHLVELGLWMIDDHQTLRRSGNTAYATAGLAAAAAWARATEHPDAAKLQCVTDRSLARLLSWQAGHPRAVAPFADAPDAPHISGGLPPNGRATSQRLDYASFLLVALLQWRSGR